MSLQRVHVQLLVISDRLPEAVWIRTIFAVVIGDVGVIIEDLEEQQSYFGIIDFSDCHW